MKRLFKKICKVFEGFLIGIGFCASIFAIDKIFKPKMEIEFTTKNKEESE